MSSGEGGKSTAILAVDTGGTFTDILLLRDGTLTPLKVPSTPDDPARAVLEGVARILREEDGKPGLLIHGSTVATNTILERTGARVALVTNAGFEDVLEIGRQDRPQLYALAGSRPPPLVERGDRLGIQGRLDPRGRELAPLAPAELEALPEALRDAEAIAVVLLHSYADPSHERTVGRALASLGIPVSLSSRILPEFREYERTASTVANAYVAPRLAGYLGRLRERAPAGRIRIMGSDGGGLPFRRAVEEPLHTVLSGPAGGVVAAREWGRLVGTDRILSFDMGGTSTDVSLIRGDLVHTREGRIGGTPIAIPLLDIHTVGAGGGSIARIDPGGALRVGPESAGADPGPIAYGGGGEEVTVTDANVWLGRLPPEGFLGGTGALHPDRIRAPMEALARKADRDPVEVAEGILEVVDTAMERALRVISVERGVDPSGYRLVAFGGAAGLHAAGLTGRLGLRSALVPPDPGLLSAYGMLVAPVTRDRARTVLLSSEDAEADARIAAILDELEGEALLEMARDGASSSSLEGRRWVDARYRGQSFELRVPANAWVEGFHRAHEERYGYRRAGAAVEAVTLRVRVRAPGEEITVRPVKEPDAVPRERTTRVVFRGRELEARLLERSGLPPGSPVPGPAVVTEYSSTTWCPPDWEVERDHWGVLELRPRNGGG